MSHGQLNDRRAVYSRHAGVSEPDRGCMTRDTPSFQPIPESVASHYSVAAPPRVARAGRYQRARIDR